MAKVRCYTRCLIMKKAEVPLAFLCFQLNETTAAWPASRKVMFRSAAWATLGAEVPGKTPMSAPIQTTPNAMTISELRDSQTGVLTS